MSKAQQGNKKHFKRGWYIDRRGYIMVLNPRRVLARPGIYVPEHRLVMEKMVGRYLTPEDHIHHIDGDPQNNWPENLELTTMAGHNRLHIRNKKHDKRGRFC